MEAINSKSCSHAFVPDKTIEIEIDRKRLNYNENLKFMPFGKSFRFYAIWELCHLGSYPLNLFNILRDLHLSARRRSVSPIAIGRITPDFFSERYQGGTS